MKPLVLVQNEVTYGGEYDHWQDLTGVSYNFPNIYRNKVVSGRRFLYYRGIRRANNQRAQAEYFGIGRIGAVWRDPSVPETTPKRKWHWFCSIEEYLPFPTPVPVKVNGVYFETVVTPLDWRTAVREISEDVFSRIISLSGSDFSEEVSDTGISPVEKLSPLIAVEDVIPVELAPDLEVLMRSSNPARLPISDISTASYRRSKRAKQIGDRAEEIVMIWLKHHLPPTVASTLKWIAREGKTPGWDIEFHNESGEIVSIEVKSTTARIFPSIEMTAREWDAAKTKGAGFWLALVTGCFDPQPGISLLKNPYQLFLNGQLESKPSVWTLRRSADKTPDHF